MANSKDLNKQAALSGKIIFLNGTSSSGKTTLIRGLQEALEEPFLEMGLDKFIYMLPNRYLNPPLWDDILGKADVASAFGHQLVYAMHRVILNMAKSGMNILADHVMVEPAWIEDCAKLFYDQDAYLIGLRCELAILEQRERERRDRTLGQARKQYLKVHSYGMYDFEVDTGIYQPVVNIQQIIAHLRSGTTPSAFRNLFSTLTTSANPIE